MSDIVQRAKEAIQGATEGPWLVNPFNAQIDIPFVDAPICQLLWPTDLRSEDETEANARFIAFARQGVPELVEELAGALEALQGLVRYAEAVRHTAGMGKNQVERLDVAKAIIGRIQP